MHQTHMNSSCDSRSFDPGAASVLAAFFIWGLLPIYWKSLSHVSPLVVIMHRMLWSFVLLSVLLLVQGRLKGACMLLRDKRVCLAVVLCSLLLGVNWLLFTVAVNSNMIVQVSLAYFMVPMLNMLNGILLFKERLSGMQWLAVALVVCGIGVQVVVFGEIPWLALGMSLSWAAYGGVHKAVRYPAMPGFFLETAALLPVLFAALMWLQPGSIGSSFTGGLPQGLLLAGGGLVTLVPQILFVFGAQRLRQTTLGLFQFLAPTLFLLVGVVLYGEHLSSAQQLSFAFIWGAMLLYSVSSLRQRR